MDVTFPNSSSEPSSKQRAKTVQGGRAKSAQELHGWHSGMRLARSSAARQKRSESGPIPMPTTQRSTRKGWKLNSLTVLALDGWETAAGRGATFSDSRLAKAPALPNASQAVDLSWMSRVRPARRTSVSQKDLVAVIDGVNRIAMSKQYDLLDSVFRSLSLPAMSAEMMLSFVRTTFPIRNRLTHWRPLVRNMHAELKRRKVNADGILQGLL